MNRLLLLRYQNRYCRLFYTRPMNLKPNSISNCEPFSCAYTTAMDSGEGSKSNHSTPESRLCSLGFDIEKIPKSAPQGSYVPCVRTGNLLFLAGHLPYDMEGHMVTGKVGSSYTADEAALFAKWATLRLLKTVESELGSLSKVKRIVKMNGYMNTTEGFEEHPKVMNGASDLLLKAFGPEMGVHARTAIGCVSLPFNVPVEIEMIVEF